MGDSRTKNSAKNILFSFINQGLVTILTFVTRTVLVKQLGADYVGINGLFSNIISVLSLAELGINLAIPYSLYGPLARGDKEKISILMRLYSRIYIFLGVFVLSVGISLTPFLHYFVNEMPEINSISLIYLLFVVNSSITYFWSYKALLITSDQKAYLLTKINNYCSIWMAVLQCIVLCITKNYLLYLATNILITLVKNIWISRKCDKLYPYIKTKYKGKLEANEIKEIKKNIFAVALYKFGTVAVGSTDGIIISKFLGVAINGIYSNYTMVTNALYGLLSQVTNGLVASVGNATAIETEDFNHLLYKRLDFINYWIFGVCSICLVSLFNPFVLIWLGQDYCLSGITVWAITMNFYTLGALSVNTIFRNTYGLFWHGKLRPLVYGIVNLTLDVILVRSIGVFGVVLATVLSRLITTSWYDPYIVFKHGLKRSPKQYYLTYIVRMVIVLCLGTIGTYAVEMCRVDSWIKWIFSGVCMFIIINVIFLILFIKTDEFKWVVNKLRRYVYGK